MVGRYPLSGIKYLYLVSVEAKTWGSASDLGGIYEAIAYKRFSTEVYYAYESPGESQRIAPDLEQVLKENGVGIVRIWHEGNQDKTRIDAEPNRSPPPPERLEAYLETLRAIDETGLTRLLHSKYR